MADDPQMSPVLAQTIDPADTNVVAAAQDVKPPMIFDASTTGYVKNGLTVGVRQGLLWAAGAVAAHGLIPNGLLGSGTADAIAGVVSGAVVMVIGQWIAAHQQNKFVVLGSEVSDAIAKVINARKAS